MIVAEDTDLTQTYINWIIFIFRFSSSWTSWRNQLRDDQINQFLYCMINSRRVTIRAGHPLVECMNRSMNRSMNQLLNRSMNQSTNWTMNHLINWSMKRSMNQSLNRSMNQSLNWSMIRSMKLFLNLNPCKKSMYWLSHRTIDRSMDAPMYWSYLIWNCRSAGSK